tara:strand:+ start:634 stop:1044 length:411 start_codon:yes stop_codon:yes gene_type:complete
MYKVKNIFDIVLFLLNIIFLLYYSIQLLLFTDEFTLNTLGFFNHAIAGLAEIIGIIFFSLSLSLIIILFRGVNNQFPLLFLIFFMELLLSLNFWRYVFTDSPGETSIDTIIFNAYIFSFMSFSMLVLLTRLKKYIY